MFVISRKRMLCVYNNKFMLWVNDFFYRPVVSEVILYRKADVDRNGIMTCPLCLTGDNANVKEIKKINFLTTASLLDKVVYFITG